MSDAFLYKLALLFVLFLPAVKVKQPLPKMHADKRRLLLMLMVIGIGSSGNGQGFSIQSCTYLLDMFHTVLSCDNLNFQDVPCDIPENTTRLSLKGNNITYLNNGAFKDLINLTTLDLRENRISEIEEDAFLGLAKLETLWLDSNNITELKNGTFKGLGNLISLFLDRNEIIQIPPRIFIDLTSLHILYLRYNQISVIERHSFIGLDHIYIIAMGNNNITELKNGTFQELDYMINFSLENNQISRIEPGTFIGMTSLRKLILKDNKINVIEKAAFTGLDNLNYLHLGDNRITMIERSAFIGLDNLIALELYRNQIVWVEKGAFIGLEGLHTLIIDADWINITSLESGAFNDLFKLRRIHLSPNPSKAVVSNILYNLHNLDQLSLNSINCSCPSKALMDWYLLRRIGLSTSNPNGNLCKGTESLFLDFDFGSCAAEDSLFQKNLSCVTCSSLAAFNECPERQITAVCNNDSHPVCFSTITYIDDKVSVSKGCMNDSTCHQLAKQNYQTCDRRLGNWSCTYCCLSETCNDKQIHQCDQGKYGIDCQGNCSGNCLYGKLCNVYTGLCVEGCTSGWTGAMCDKKCSHGFYGLNCSHRCDYCDLSCHHKSGECLMVIKTTTHPTPSNDPDTNSTDTESTTVQEVVMTVFIALTFISMMIIAVLILRRYRTPCRNEKLQKRGKSTVDTSASKNQVSEIADMHQHYEGLNPAFTTENAYEDLQSAEAPEYENTYL